MSMMMFTRGSEPNTHHYCSLTIFMNECNSINFVCKWHHRALSSLVSLYIKSFSSEISKTTTKRERTVKSFCVGQPSWIKMSKWKLLAHTHTHIVRRLFIVPIPCSLFCAVCPLLCVLCADKGKYDINKIIWALLQRRFYWLRVNIFIYIPHINIIAVTLPSFLALKKSLLKWYICIPANTCACVCVHCTHKNQKKPKKPKIVDRLH